MPSRYRSAARGQRLRWAGPALAGASAMALTATGLCGQIALAGYPSLREQGDSADLARLLTSLAAGAAAAVGAWLTVCTVATWVALLCVDSRVWGRPATWVALATTPPCLRPALGALLAGSLALAAATPASARDLLSEPRGASTAGVAQPAYQGARADGHRACPATQGPGTTPTATPSPLAAALPAPGWLPAPPRPAHSRGCAREATVLVTSADRRLRPEDEIVVRRGDTLWHLAARTLGPSASAAEIAAEWPRWWHANRQLIGADPDLLLPGMRLSPPGPQAAPFPATNLPEKVR